MNFENIDFDYYIEKCEKNMHKYIGNDEFKEMYKNLKLNKFYPVISELPFVEKWVMVNNQQEYKSSFWNYLMGQWGLVKSFFIGDEDGYLSIIEIHPSNHEDCDKMFLINNKQSKKEIKVKECYFDKNMEGASDHIPLIGIFEIL